MFEIFQFLSYTGDYEDRKIGRFDCDEYTISTVAISDSEANYETAIRRGEEGDWKVVDNYLNKEEATKGHKYWVQSMKENPQQELTDCGLSYIQQGLRKLMELCENEE